MNYGINVNIYSYHNQLIFVCPVGSPVQELNSHGLYEIWGTSGDDDFDIGLLDYNALKMEAVCSSETLVYIYEFTRRYSTTY
jgi:hypothetical protein